MTIVDSEGHIYSTNSSSIWNPVLIVVALLLALELLSAVDSTIGHFNDYPDQHLKLFFDRNELNDFFITDGGILTNVDQDMFGITYLASYYHYNSSVGR